MIRVNYRYPPSHRGFSQQPPSGGPQSTFPGIGDPFAGGGSSQNLPAVTQAMMPGQLTTAAPAKAGGFSLGNLSELKNVIDRMGGIDGIVNTVSKMQKVFSSVQQMAPMVKLLMGSIGKKGAVAKKDDDEWVPSKRRRRRRRRRYGSTSKKRTRVKSTPLTQKYNRTRR
ncbi:tyrosine protein kinase [Paenibacillus tarimensis]